MATTKQQLIKEIKELEEAQNSDLIPAEIKEDLRKEIAASKKQLAELEEAEKKANSRKPEVKKEGEQKKKKALDKVKERIKKAKDTKKVVAKKEKEVKEEKPKRTPKKSAPKTKRKPRVAGGSKRDASRKALKPGWKKSKETGKWYYEDRANRTDRQRKSYPYLEDGGTTDFTNDGAGMFAGGGVFDDNKDLSRDRMFKSKEKWEQKYKRKSSPKNPRYNTKKKISKYAGGGVTDTPKIYVADLSAYNDGKLVGEWVDLSEFDSGAEVMDKISELLKGWSESSGELREEYAIHDYENFSRSLYSEYMGEDDFDKVIKIYKIAEEKDIPADVIGTVISEYDPSDISDFIDERYEGQFDSDTDLAYHYVEMLGGIEQLGKDTTERYFDYEAFGRDLAFDYNNYDGYYFRSYKRGGQLKSYNIKKYMSGGATDFVNSGAGMFENGGDLRMYRFLKIDLEKLENAIKENDTEEINSFFSYWGTHLESIKTQKNERMWNFMLDDLKELKEDIKEGDKDSIDKFFSYWTGSGGHIESLKKYASGGATDFVNSGAGMFAGGGKIKDKVETLYKKADKLWQDFVGNGGRLNYSEKNYGYLSDELTEVEVGYLGIRNDSTYADELRSEKFKLTGKEAYDILKHRIESIEDELKEYASGGATDFVNNGAGMFANGGATGEPHKLDASGDMFADGGAIVDYSYGLLSDPRFDVHSSVFKKGGKISNKYNYLSKWNIATITTDDGAVIDGNDIIDGIYVKKKVKF